MDSLSSSRRSERPDRSTPLKSLARPTPAPSPSNQISTPEKSIEQPTQTRRRNVAFSLREVRKVASGLQRHCGVSGDQGERIGGQNKGSPAESVGLSSDVDGVRSDLAAKSRAELPERYNILVEFFNAMVSSIRLLQLKGRMTSFSKICQQVESLTNRRFSYSHLAQLRHILPEAICVKKILLHDEATSCMKPDLQVTLQIDAFRLNKDQKSVNGYSLVNKAFRHRLLEFCKEHPEGDDVPEMELPEPFNRTMSSLVPIRKTDLDSQSTVLEIAAPSMSNISHLGTTPSHMPVSFQRRFSGKSQIASAEKLIAGDNHAKEASGQIVPVSTIPSQSNYALKPPTGKRVLLDSYGTHMSVICSNSTNEETAKKVMPSYGDDYKENALVGTPSKIICTPSRLMSTTPQLQTPKRHYPGTQDDLTPVKTMRRSTRTKLFTSPLKNVMTEDQDTDGAVDDVLQFLPKALLQSVREKERKAQQDKETGVADAEKRRQMIACLPKLFDMILLIFQSIRRSVITKQELVHMIIANHHDIVDGSEVEEQLTILQEVIPDWISAKMASSGDFLFSVSHTSCPEELRRRISEAE